MLKSVTLEVVGDQRLVCESCELRVKRLLSGVKGVGKVHAHARTQRIDVLFDQAVLDATAITDRLRTAGYESRVVNAASNAGNDGA